jgi:outer membrane protein assembly factor BamB
MDGFSMRNCYARAVIIASVLASAGIFIVPALYADDWPQWLGPQRDGVWREQGVLQTFPKDGPKVLWRMPIHEGYGGPAVVGDRIYVMDRERPLDEEGKPARATRAGIPGKERILCLSTKDGKLIWQNEYDCPYTISYPTGPRVTPLVRDGRVYTVGAMGDLRCLGADRGEIIWSKNLIKEYKLDAPPVWGWASHLLLDGELLYSLVGGEGSAVVAFNKNDGKEVWKQLTTEEIGYSPPMIYELAGKKTLVIWLSESVNGLDPTTGKVLWTQTYPLGAQVKRPVVSISTVRNDKDRLFVTSFYHGPMMLEIAGEKPEAKIVWKSKSTNWAKPEGLNCVMSTPVLHDGYIYGIGGMGELQCIDAKTGEKMWETTKVLNEDQAFCGTAFIVPAGGHFLLFNDHGDLILADLTPKGYTEIGRAHLLEPSQNAMNRDVVWSHPAFSNRCMFARNDKEIICVSLAA